MHDSFTGLTGSSSTGGGLFKQILGNNKENVSYIVLGFLSKDLGKMQRGLCSEKLPLTISCLLQKGIWGKITLGIYVAVKTYTAKKTPSGHQVTCSGSPV